MGDHDPVSRRIAVRIVTADPDAPDARTTLADLRSALAVARGRDLSDVCPVTGYDLSPQAYRVARDGWAALCAAGPLNKHRAAGYRRAREVWSAARPVLAADWPTAEYAPGVAS